MPKNRKISESYSVSYTARDVDSSDDVKAISMNWDNRSIDEVKDNLNTFLLAIGCQLEVVEKK